jgi:hypothetical protein
MTARPGPERCPCGQSLHYTDPRNQAAVETIIAQLGPTITVQVGGHSYQVPGSPLTHTHTKEQ